MLQFIIGVFVGTIIGFLICAVLSVNNSESGENQIDNKSQEIGDSDARNQ